MTTNEVGTHTYPGFNTIYAAVLQALYFDRAIYKEQPFTTEEIAAKATKVHGSAITKQQTAQVFSVAKLIDFVEHHNETGKWLLGPKADSWTIVETVNAYRDHQTAANANRRHQRTDQAERKPKTNNGAGETKTGPRSKPKVLKVVLAIGDEEVGFTLDQLEELQRALRITTLYKLTWSQQAALLSSLDELLS